MVIKRPDGKLGKANSPYFYGGPTEAINMLNRNFDLNIEDYVTVDFAVVAEVVDLLGGIEVDVDDKEAEEMNRHIDGTADVVGKETAHVKAGVQTLDGVQAVTYARIRKNVGGDYERTVRQRELVQKLVEKAKKAKLETVNDIIDTVFKRISTSITLDEMLGLASHVFQYELGETKGYAFEYTDGNVEGIGSVVIPAGALKNVESLQAFLYPEQKYVPTDTVKNITEEIDKATGYKGETE